MTLDLTATPWIVAVAVLAVTAYVLGRLVTRWPVLGLSFRDRLERDVVSAALGLALLAHLLLCLGFVGLLGPWTLLLLTFLIHACGLRIWSGGLRPRLAWVLAALAAILPMALLASYPPTAFDATMYHLPFARAFAESGGMPFLPDLRFPVFPQANEILFAAVMLFGGDVAAHGVQLFATLLIVGLLIAWGRGAWSPAAGWLAAAVFLGNPVVVHLAASAYIEPGLALFITAGIFALDRWRRGGGRGWLVLAAAFTATAADVKYLGLFFLTVAGLVVIVVGGRSRPAAARVRDTLLFSGVAAAFLAPWYLRIYIHTGNPLFPYLPRLFGSSVWTAKMSPDPGEMGFGQLVRLVRLPWDLVFERKSSGGQPPFSPVYLAALPLLAAGAVRDSRVRFPLLIAGAFGLVWTRLPPDSRYLVTVLPLASLAVAGAAAPWLGRSRRWAAVLCLGCFLPGWLYAGYRVQSQGAPPVTAEQREAYLARKLAVYPALAHLNRTRGSRYTVWSLYAENMVYFAEGRFLGDWVGSASFPRVLAGARDARAFHGALRRVGATHLLIPVRSVSGGAVTPPIPEDAAFRRWFRLVYQDQGARVYELK